MSKAKAKPKQDEKDTASKGVLAQHSDRMKNDKDYRDSALTPPTPIGANPDITVKD